MKISALAAVLLVTMTVSGYSQAQRSREPDGVYMKGDTLNDHCRVFLSMRQKNMEKAPQGYSAGVCYGYVIGVVDLYAEFRIFCTGGATAHSVIKTVASYLDQHPEERNTAAYFLVTKSVSEKYPC